MVHNHPIYRPLYTDTEHFIILITGGRASGKSFSAATFIERLTFEMKKRKMPSGEVDKIVHNILFTRYTMASAGISVIPEFMEKIEKDGTEDYFHATKTDVVNNLTGARVMFRGIKTSSGNQTAKLKSIHGITTFVCDEAEEWQSEDDFNTIMLSIRQKGIQNRVIIIMNPTDKNHFVYDKYIKDTHRIEYFDGVPVQISTHPNVLHIHTTYLDNIANLSDEFVKEAQYNKENKPKVYAHTFMGRWTDEVEGRVFNNYEYCDEFPEGAKHLGIGLDFGYSSDPTAIVRCGLVGNDLYIDELCYKTHMLSSDIIKELQPYSYNNGYGNALPVIADSADPRLIQEIANGGILIYPVNKSGGSINAGIDKMQTFDHIYITRRSRNAKMEFDNYTWDKDKDGNYINVPIDAYNHCFTGDTIVLTGFGECRIDGLREGMLVATSQGFRKVTRFFDNGRKPVVKATLKYEHGEVVVTATPDHKIKTTNGWIELKDLKQGMEIFLAKSLTAKSTTNTKARGTIQEAQKECTLQYGNTTTAMCRKVTMYTIKTRIPRTTKYQTSNYCQPLNTCQTTQRNGLKRVVNLNECEQIWTKPERLQANGMEVMRAGLGTHYTQSNRYEKNMRKCAKSAEVSTSHFIQALAGFAPTNARLHGEDTKGLTTRCEFASIAEKSLLYPSTSRKTTAKSATILSSQMVQGEQAQSGNGTMTARLLDVSITDAGVQHVYDIEVEEMHEFFANGVLVHNCIDATRYYTLGKLLGRILQPRRIDVNNLGIF